MIMDYNELIEKINIVFNQELNNREGGHDSYSFVIYGEEPSLNIDYAPLIEPEPEKVRLEYSTMETLKKLYLFIENDLSLKSHFIQILTNKIEKEEPIKHHYIIYDLTDLAFITLIYINNVDIALDSLIKRNNELVINSHLKFLEGFIHNHYHYMNENQLKRLRKFISETDINVGSPSMWAQKIIKMIDKILFKNLNLQLEGIDFEFNLDKKKVQDMISKYGFNKKVSEALDKIDKEYYKVSEDAFDLRNNISLLKEVFDDFMSSISSELIKITGKKPEKKHEKEHDTEMKHRYIGENLMFSEGETRTMGALNQMLNEEKHSLISKKEKSRITKNFTIEFILLTLTKFQKIKKNEPKPTKKP